MKQPFVIRRLGDGANWGIVGPDGATDLTAGRPSELTNLMAFLNDAYHQGQIDVMHALEKSRGPELKQQKARTRKIKHD